MSQEALLSSLQQFERVSRNATFEIKLLATKAWEAAEIRPQEEFVQAGKVVTAQGLTLETDLGAKIAVVYVDGAIYETMLVQTLSADFRLGLWPDLDTKKPITEPGTVFKFAKQSISTLAALNSASPALTK